MLCFRGICSLFKALLVLSAIASACPVYALEDSDYPQRMQLTADGQILTLMLRPSRITENLGVKSLNGSPLSVPVNSYIGKIQGDDDSWVRLTQSSSSLEGVISRFGKRFRLHRSGTGAVKIKPIAANHDLRVSLTQNNAVDNPIVSTASLSKVTRVAKIAIVVDSQFNAKHNGKGLEYALSLINSVDGIYREEFGLALQVVTAINIQDKNNDPLMQANVNVETMLRRFRDFRIQNTDLDQSVSLVHLFTGNIPSDAPVGLAWIDTACRQDGYDVGLSTPYSHDILLVAHEIAHNLGAMHDTETACAASNDNVMWPYISSRTSQHFSSCTVNTVKRRIAESCHAPAVNFEMAAAMKFPEKGVADYGDNKYQRTNKTLPINLPLGAAVIGNIQGLFVSNSDSTTTAFAVYGVRDQAELSKQTSGNSLTTVLALCFILIIHLLYRRLQSKA